MPQTDTLNTLCLHQEHGKPYTSPQEIKANLIAQLTAPVRWTKTIQQMIADGATTFYEFGPGDVLKGLIRKINAEVEVG